jgi:hypothetical protein
MIRGALLVAVGVLAGCAPISREQAERDCLRDAQLAERPRGEVRLGVGTGIRRPGVDLEISSDFLLGRSPEDVWRACVTNRSGQLPSRPYKDMRS